MTNTSGLRIEGTRKALPGMRTSILLYGRRQLTNLINGRMGFIQCFIWIQYFKIYCFSAPLKQLGFVTWCYFSQHRAGRTNHSESKFTDWATVVFITEKYLLYISLYIIWLYLLLLYILLYILNNSYTLQGQISICVRHLFMRNERELIKSYKNMATYDKYLLFWLKCVTVDHTTSQK